MYVSSSSGNQACCWESEPLWVNCHGLKRCCCCCCNSKVGGWLTTAELGSRQCSLSTRVPSNEIASADCCEKLWVSSISMAMASGSKSLAWLAVGGWEHVWVSSISSLSAKSASDSVCCGGECSLVHSAAVDVVEALSCGWAVNS